jgi:selenide,water dikinase
MARSMRLGHCVCDPRKPCPCPLFREKNVCTCAGERVPPEATGKPVRLTDHVRSAGCASKIGQKDLHRVLAMLPPVKDPRLLVGMATADDAGVFRLAEGVTIVQTVDVFTPTVDDPRLFGRIAACNSLSDVYAMGGAPVTALSVIGFPIEALPHEVMAEILRGGMEVLEEAGTVLLGGHSINDEEIKFGFAVTGLVREADIVTNAGARPGDLLVLTKPLGTGIVSLAGRIGRASAESQAAAASTMGALNRRAAEVMVRHGATACTDVTGFGLLGHLAQMTRESGAGAEVWVDRLPLLPGVLEYARAGIFSGANERNAEASAGRTRFAEGVGEEWKAVLFDAQTSGGLLVALPAERAEAALSEMREAGIVCAGIVGRIVNSPEAAIEVCREAEGRRAASAPAGPGHVEEQAMNDSAKASGGERACCAGGAGSPEQAMKMFQDFMGTALQPGALDVVTKELLAVALALVVDCEQCARIHIRKAMESGIGRDELEEAAALAVAFGGCRVMMLWTRMKKETGLVP